MHLSGCAQELVPIGGKPPFCSVTPQIFLSEPQLGTQGAHDHVECATGAMAKAADGEVVGPTRVATRVTTASALSPAAARWRGSRCGRPAARRRRRRACTSLAARPPPPGAQAPAAPPRRPPRMAHSAGTHSPAATAPAWREQDTGQEGDVKWNVSIAHAGLAGCYISARSLPPVFNALFVLTS